MSTLADQIIAKAADQPSLSPDDPMPGVLKRAAAAIRGAARFVVGDDAREATYRVVLSRPSTMIEALTYARPPFATSWFEWTPGAGERALNLAQIKPKRIGALITRTGPHAWTMWTAWSYDVRAAVDKARESFGAEVAAVAMAYDPGIGVSTLLLGVDLTRPLDAPSLVVTKPQWMPLRGIASLTDAELAKLRNDRTNPLHYALKDRRERAALESLDRRMGYQIREPGLLNSSLLLGEDGVNAAISDVQDEIASTLALLILINSKNCVEVAPSAPPPKLNRARAKRGQTPLVTYSTVRINLSRTQRNAAAARGLSETEMQLHKVRGHFKVRRTGVFWWNDYERGSAAHGTVEQSYVVEDA